MRWQNDGVLGGVRVLGCEAPPLKSSEKTVRERERVLLHSIA